MTALIWHMHSLLVCSELQGIKRSDNLNLFESQACLHGVGLKGSNYLFRRELQKFSVSTAREYGGML